MARRTLRGELSQELVRYSRSEVDVSLVSEVISYMIAARSDGLPIAPDELPITVGAATLHADTLAAMPARSYASSIDSRVRLLLETPDPETDYRAAIHSIVLGMFWHGYAPVLLDRPAPFTNSIRTIDPRLASYDERADRATGYGWTINGQKVRSDLVYAVSLMNDPRRGPLGESPLRRCWQALTMYGYAYRYLIDFYAQGGNPSSILKSTHKLGSPRATELVSEWITARQERRPAMMGPEISFEVPSSNSELQDTLRALDHCAAEVARLLNMPGTLVNAPSAGYSLTYANAQDELRRWIALSLKPSWMSRIESMFRTLTGDPTIELDPTELLELYVSIDQPTETPAIAPAAAERTATNA